MTDLVKDETGGKVKTGKNNYILGIHKFNLENFHSQNTNIFSKWNSGLPLVSHVIQI